MIYSVTSIQFQRFLRQAGSKKVFEKGAPSKVKNNIALGIDFNAASA
jgi:glutamine phosphoribosylpyrophosphate amidotransferase